MRSVEAPLPAVTAGGTHLGVVEPLVMRSDCQGGNGSNVRGAREPVFTPTTNGGLAVVEPFLLPQHFGNPARSVDLPAPPPVAIDRTALVAPFVFANRTNNVPKAIDSPLPTNTTTTGGGIGLVEAFTFPTNQGRERARGLRSVDEPLDTIVTKDMKGLVEPFVLSQGAGGAPRGVAEPMPTIPTEGAHALVAPYYGASECASVEEPLGTVTTRDRFALIAPVTHVDGSMRARSTDAPLPTVTGAARGELGFVVGAFGERPGQAPRVRSLEEPAPTICAKGRIPFVHGVTLEDLQGVDILFRMLEPEELAGAMGFPARYRFKGNKTERTRMIGNAVAVNTARALVKALMESAA